MADEPGVKFHCLRAMVEGGHIARMNRTELAVYISLYNDADGRTCEVKVSAERVARSAGMGNIGRVRKTMTALETQNYLEVVAEVEWGGRGKVKVRKLLAPPPLPATPLFDDVGGPDEPSKETAHTSETGTPHVPVSHTPKGGQFQHTKGDTFDRKGGRFRTETGTPHVPHSQLSQNFTALHGDGESAVCPPGGTPPRPNHSPAPAPPAPPSYSAEVFDYLRKAGIYDHDAMRYAAIYTLARVQELHRVVLNKPKVRDRGAFFNSVLTKNMPTNGAA